MKSKTPPRGMRDFLPIEVNNREHIMNIIQKNYEAWGFQKIETPSVENISLLSNGEAGENEKMIYKILKRGEKLNLDEVKNESDLVDYGLRFDLTVPLTRYFANNRENLIYPFKSIQIGSVWRAERPQKGRFRQFTQCDIDIIGDPTNKSEITLLSAATDALYELGFKQFTLRINDRRISEALAENFSFSKEDFNSLFITLDKMDKIGTEGVLSELHKKGFSKINCERFIDFLIKANKDTLSVDEKISLLPDNIEKELISSLKELIDVFNKHIHANIVLDFTLIRGMSYYTGPIFEIEVEEFGSSIAGGGRYDRMISKSSNKTEPACGISIGFERIIALIEDKQLYKDGTKRKVALLHSKETGIEEIIQKAKDIKKNGYIVSIYLKKKNFKHQLKELKENGFKYYKYVEDETNEYNEID